MPGVILLITTLLITALGGHLALNCTSLQFESERFSRICADDSANTSGIFAGPLTARNVGSCMAMCYDKKACFFFNLIQGQHCFAVSTGLPAPPQYPYPMAYMTYASDNTHIRFLCDMTTEISGWYILQRRYNGLVNFYRDWDAYKLGFGTLDTEFWIGLEAIYRLSSGGNFELRVDLEYNGTSAYAVYSAFAVGAETDNYRLSIGYYSYGTAGDSIGVLNGCAFTTIDHDHDNNPHANCTVDWGGGWWFDNCALANLNGLWGVDERRGPYWDTFTMLDSANFTEIKVRRLLDSGR